eukprot:2580785-Amphidinium_carterae.1
MTEQTGERLRDPISACVFWVLTPTGDIYPEELVTDEETCCRLLSRENERPQVRARRGFGADDPVIEFEAGVLSPVTFCEALEQVEIAEGATFSVDQSALAGEGEWSIGCSSCPGLAGKKLDEKIVEKVQVGDLAIVRTASGVSVVAREPATFENSDSDAR